MTRNVLRSVIVHAPPDRAFNIWSDFESFPTFMGPIVRVTREGQSLTWRAMLDGELVEWEAEIVEFTPPRRVAWHATRGRHHNVVVTIRPIDDVQTEVTLGAEYVAGSREHGRRTIRYEEFLRDFKDLVERPAAPGQAPEFGIGCPPGPG